MELSNAIRGHLAELGLVAPIGRIGLQRLIETIDDETDEGCRQGLVSASRCWPISFSW
jgi:hypothetical protein